MYDKFMNNTCFKLPSSVEEGLGVVRPQKKSLFTNYHPAPWAPLLKQAGSFDTDSTNKFVAHPIIPCETHPCNSGQSKISRDSA